VAGNAFPPEMVEKMAALYDAGMGSRAIAKELHVSGQGVLGCLRRHGVRIRPTGVRAPVSGDSPFARGIRSPKWREQHRMQLRPVLDTRARCKLARCALCRVVFDRSRDRKYPQPIESPYCWDCRVLSLGEKPPPVTREMLEEVGQLMAQEETGDRILNRDLIE